MRPTADQVIQEYDALSSEDKQRVYVTIVERTGDVPLAETNDPEGFKKAMEQILGVSLELTPGDAFEKPDSSRIKKILWKDTLIYFVPNEYIQNHEEIWRIESILGSDTVRKGLGKYEVLNENVIERLFSQSPYFFYVNQPETYLFSDYGEISESNGGPLKQLTALDTLQRYGLKLMEESKEKQYVRL